MYFLIVRHTINLPGAKIRARSHIHTDRGSNRKFRPRERRRWIFICFPQKHRVHTNKHDFFAGIFFILARIHYLFFDGALFTFYSRSWVIFLVISKFYRKWFPQHQPAPPAAPPLYTTRECGAILWLRAAYLGFMFSV